MNAKEINKINDRLADIAVSLSGRIASENKKLKEENDILVTANEALREEKADHRISLARLRGRVDSYERMFDEFIRNK